VATAAAPAPAAVVVLPVNQAAQNGLNNANVIHICGVFCHGSYDSLLAKERLA
jgi:hypothetical protein